MLHLRLLGGVELSARDGGPDRRLNVAPKPLALLAYLAVANARSTPVRRDVLLGLFWPELSTDRGRAALRQLLFQLRRTMGADALRADRESISLASDALSCDVQAFEQCLALGDRAGAMEAYGGPLLEGFFTDGASDALEDWIDSERRRLNWRAFLASRELADEAERAGNGIAAAQWARAAAALAPDNEIAVRRLIQILDSFGDRAGALRVAEDFARHLSSEFGTTPSAETNALIAAVRAGRSGAANEPPRRAPLEARAPIRTDSAAPLPETATTESLAQQNSSRDIPPARRVRRGALLTGAAGLTVIVATAALFVTAPGHGATPAAGHQSAVYPPITIASPVARRLYSEALERYHAIDNRESARLFTAALAEDSNCAMCAYYAALSYTDLDDTSAARMLQRSMRLAARVSDAERLLIRYRWADVTNSPARTAAADSLVNRYPDWSEAQIAAAAAAGMNANWLDAAAHLRRALAAAPLPDSALEGRCPACSAELQLYITYESADSLPAALRLAQEWVQAQPRSRRAWLQLSRALAQTGRFDEARAALDSSTRYAMGADDDVIEHAQIEMRAGNFAVADRLLSTVAETGNAETRDDALWFLVISLRAQGRLREALDAVNGAMRRAAAVSTEGLGNVTTAEAQIRFERGEYRRAAAMFEATTTPPDSFSRTTLGRSARQHAWVLTHAGSAMAAAGDTIALARLADTVQAWGKLSGFERDHRLHHYLRGLLWVARSRPESAVVAFRRGITSETQGFSRMDLELARTLIQLGRAREAIPVLEHALGGSLDAGNFYVTRTELQETLAHAFDAAGEPDSATVYYRAVIGAWHAADPELRRRVAAARDQLAADERKLIVAQR